MTDTTNNITGLPPFTSAASHKISVITKGTNLHWKAGNDKFTNPWKEWTDPSSSLYNLLCLQKEMIPQLIKGPTQFHLPVQTLEESLIKHPPCSDKIQFSWIGHSTFLVQIDGVNILTDPVFSYRCAPTQYFGPARIVSLPCSIKDLPVTVDIVVVSHNHYDHLDYQSIIDLNQYHKPSFFVPLKLKQWFMDVGVAEDRVIELDWWQSFEYKNFKMTFLPAMHWSTRSVSDKNKTLWGSWSVLSCNTNKKFYFAGDTGYCSDLFKEIGNNEGPFDVAFIPIGAYEPRWFMAPQHVNPEEAVQISLDIQSNKSVGMHWGTFILTTEPTMEPKSLLEKELIKRQLNPDYFITMNHGQTISM
jgi:N-acyl-phosphatidylethanolamine-hydrolysing phospholipase D